MTLDNPDSWHRNDQAERVGGIPCRPAAFPIIRDLWLKYPMGIIGPDTGKRQRPGIDPDEAAAEAWVEIGVRINKNRAVKKAKSINESITTLSQIWK